MILCLTLSPLPAKQSRIREGHILTSSNMLFLPYIVFYLPLPEPHLHSQLHSGLQPPRLPSVKL